jgi:hypothetical protein
MPRDRWSNFGDKREARRLKREGLWYDPTFNLKPTTLLDDWLQDAIAGRWEGRTCHIGEPRVVCSLDFYRWLMLGARAEVRPIPNQTPCVLYAKHMGDVIRMWGNEHAARPPAAFCCSANKIGPHDKAISGVGHSFVLAVAPGGWQVCDVASGSMYPLSPEDDEFFGLEL